MDFQASPEETGTARPAYPQLRPHPPYTDPHVSTAPYARARPSETVAGFLAAVAIFVSLTGVVYRPLRLIPLAILLALISVGIGGRHQRLASYAVGICALSFVLGMAAAVVTSHPLW